ASADENRLAQGAHLLVARRLERDLRPDARRIADGDGEARLHSSLTPAVRITAPQRSVSWRMKARVSAGPSAIGSAESSARRFCTSGSLSASRTSAPTFSAMALGVLGGPTMANHAIASKPGKVSASAGTPGSEAMRFALATASALSLPERTWGTDTPTLSHIMST